MKKLVACALGAVMCAAAVASFAGCGDDYAPYNPDIDLSKKPRLEVLMPNSGMRIEEVNSDPNAAVVKQVTGYDVKYSQLDAMDSDARLDILMIDHAKYNAIKVTSTQFANLIATDMCFDLTPVIEKFGPVLKEVISEESWSTVTVDGKIYGIPEHSSSDNIQYPLIFHKEILDELKLQLPTTPAELKTVLQKIKEKEPNVTPLTYNQYTPVVWPIAAGFGIYADWQVYEIDGKEEVRYYMDSPNYADYVNYMADLYESGLIDKDADGNTDAAAVLKFTGNTAASIATSIWSVSALVPPGTNTTMENDFAYLRALKYKGEEHANRLGGCPYITVIPYYMQENAGYVIDWINSKLTDTEEAHNFRDIVLGEEGYHWQKSTDYIEGTVEYIPIAEHFSEKDTASYFLTGSNEEVYTQYWLARVKKQPELERAWKILMTDADEVGVYDVLDLAPPLTKYAEVRASIEQYAQGRFFVMVGTDKGASKLSEYLAKWRTDGGTAATKEINDWYFSK